MTGGETLAVSVRFEAADHAERTTIEGDELLIGVVRA